MFGTVLAKFAITGIGKWMLGGGLTELGKIGVDAYKTKLDAENTTEVQVANLAKQSMDLDGREAELNNKLNIVEQGNWFTRWVRPMWAAPFVIWTWQAVVYDKVYMHGTTSTDPLSGMLGTLCLLIAGSYFGERLGSKWIEKVMSFRGAITGGRR